MTPPGNVIEFHGGFLAFDLGVNVADMWVEARCARVTMKCRTGPGGPCTYVCVKQPVCNV